jgi:hypothetical protein
MKEDDVYKFDAELSAPVRGSASDQVAAAVGPWSRDAELAQFQRG